MTQSRILDSFGGSDTVRLHLGLVVWLSCGRACAVVSIRHGHALRTVSAEVILSGYTWALMFANRDRACAVVSIRRSHAFRTVLAEVILSGYTWASLFVLR